MLVKVVTATQLETVFPHAALAFQSPGRFNYRDVEFVWYSAFTGIDVGGRRMGKPLGQYPGRAKARPTA